MHPEDGYVDDTPAEAEQEHQNSVRGPPPVGDVYSSSRIGMNSRMDI